ncbi:MAG TPA: FapA family protein [bacterium]|nr:FapA family protein [bacterium]HPN30804.1 FapA family protein [bacterium]
MDTVDISEYFTIVIDEYFYNATISYELPDNINVEQVDNEYIKLLLAEKNCIYGIAEENIERFVAEIKSGKKSIKRILAAEYLPEKNGEDARIDWVCLEKQDKPSESGSQERIDHKSKSGIIIVLNEEILCVKINAKSGINGKKINGEDIIAKDGKDVLLRYGTGVETEEFINKTIYKSNCDGRLVLKEDFVEVQTTLTIDGDVNFETGNIIYIDDVVINGNVVQGFKIETPKNIYISGAVEDGVVINCGGSVIIKGGVIGETAEINAENRIEADFAHYSRLVSQGEVIIHKFALNSKIYARNLIDIRGNDIPKNHSAVVGGDLSSDREIKIHSIGGMLAGRSYLKVCDLSEKLNRHAADENILKSKLIKILRTVKLNCADKEFCEFLKNLPVEKKELYKSLLYQIKYLIAEIQKKQNEKKLLRKRILDDIEFAKIIVENPIMPTVVIKIFDKYKKIDEIHPASKFEYDKNEKCIATSFYFR